MISHGTQFGDIDGFKICNNGEIVGHNEVHVVPVPQTLPPAPIFPPQYPPASGPTYPPYPYISSDNGDRYGNGFDRYPDQDQAHDHTGDRYGENFPYSSDTGNGAQEDQGSENFQENGGSYWQDHDAYSHTANDDWEPDWSDQAEQDTDTNENGFEEDDLFDWEQDDTNDIDDESDNEDNYFDQANDEDDQEDDSGNYPHGHDHDHDGDYDFSLDYLWSHLLRDLHKDLHTYR